MATVLSDLAARPGEGVPAACATPVAATKAAYRILASAAVVPAAMVDAHVTATADRAWGEATILALQWDRRCLLQPPGKKCCCCLASAHRAFLPGTG